MIPRKLRMRLHRLLKPRGKAAFLMTVAPAGILLDVGCGNDSPARFKAARADIRYIGLDIEDYNQHGPARVIADSYILTTPGAFAEEIRRLSGQLDAVISSHNLEHCDEPNAVLVAMVKALKPGGRLFLSFPCEESVNFPSGRRGCLNFNDDPSHHLPPDFNGTMACIQSNGMRVIYARKRYRPGLLWCIGLVLEPVSAVLKMTIPGGATWAFYGFESIIWAERVVPQA